jgi:hypothetical protein
MNWMSQFWRGSFQIVEITQNVSHVFFFLRGPGDWLRGHWPSWQASMVFLCHSGRWNEMRWLCVVNWKELWECWCIWRCCLRIRVVTFPSRFTTCGYEIWGSYCVEDVSCGLLECDVVLPPSSGWNGVGTFLRNVGNNLEDHTAPQPRRPRSTTCGIWNVVDCRH